MTDSERQQVLKMVEEGKISAEDGLKLMQALGESDPVEATDLVETVPAPGETHSYPDFDRKINRFRRLWLIPLSSGILLSVLSASWMYAAMQGTGLSFWFYCAFVFFLLGVAAIVIGFDSRTSRWLYVNVLQKPGETPTRIVFSFPLAPVSWLVSLFGKYIPAEQKGAVDDVLRAVFRSGHSDEPFFVDVNGEDGQHVQIYIG